MQTATKPIQHSTADPRAQYQVYRRTDPSLAESIGFPKSYAELCRIYGYIPRLSVLDPDEILFAVDSVGKELLIRKLSFQDRSDPNELASKLDSEMRVG